MYYVSIIKWIYVSVVKFGMKIYLLIFIIIILIMIKKNLKLNNGSI